MKDWKHYAKLIRGGEFGPYNMTKDTCSDKKRRKKAKKFSKKWGFRYEETWSLDNSIACYVLPRLAFLRDNTCGYPSCFCELDENGQVTNGDEGAKKWKEILNKMVVAFEIILTVDCFKRTEEQNKQVEEGLQLFAEHFEGLWD